MRFVSLFAGVGGFERGFEQAGMTCVGQVEKDKACLSVLGRHWPHVPKHDDVTTAREWASDIGLVGAVDLVCGGFPCQDVSVAGKRAGLAGERTGLFWDALAFASHVEARWVVLENVPGLLSSNQGRDFGTVIAALADAGYPHVEWRVLDSQFFGIPQRRRRVFIVASVGADGGRAVLVEREGVRWDPAPSFPQGADVAGSAAGGAGSGRVAATLNSGGNSGGFRTEPGEHLVVVDPFDDPATAESWDRYAHSLHTHTDAGQQLRDAASGVSGDHRHRRQIRPGHGVAGGAVVNVIGTLSGGAHPGGLNGQDAYSGQLVVVREDDPQRETV